MQNRISNIADDTVIDDFLKGSDDRNSVKSILERVPTTADRLFFEADQYITVDERAHDLIDRRRDDRGKAK